MCSLSKIKVKNLLTDFENLGGLKRSKGFFVEDGETIYPFSSSAGNNCDEALEDYIIKKYKVQNRPVYVKPYKTESRVFNEVLFGRVLNKADTNSVYSYPILLKNDNMSHTNVNNMIYLQDKDKWFTRGLMSQDVNEIGLYCVRGDEVIDKLFEENFSFFERKKIQNPFVFLQDNDDFDREINSKNGMAFISIEDEDFKQMLLEIMTPECLDELNLLIMETNVSGLDDVNSENLFFYKLDRNSEKFDGVIILDNEFTIFENGDVSHNILLSDVNDKARFKELCEDIITKERTSWSPFCFLNNSHKDRIKIINDLIYDGKLSSSQIAGIKKLLEFDYDKEMINVCKTYQGIYVPVQKIEAQKYLIDFNRNNLEL